MRILSFSERWTKLNKSWFEPNLLTFTTFRYPRRDKDWEVEEVVKIVYKTRSPNREELGMARIIRKDEKNTEKRWSYYPLPSFPNTPDMITPEEAKEDGFTGMHGGGDVEKLLDWLRESAGIRFYREHIVHKLTLYWIEKYNQGGIQ